MISRRSRKDIRVARERHALARTIRNSIVAAACGLWTLAPSAMAAPNPEVLPQDGVVTKGTATIETSGATMNINQTSDRAVIEWKNFNIGKDAIVNFNQTKDGVQNTAAMTLNRVMGTSVSEIYGKINSVGSVILVNPFGVLFAEGSEVNAAGIVASTAEIDDTKFMAGELSFFQKNTSNNNITVNGTLNAAINGDYLAAGGAYAQSLAASSLNIGERQVVKEISTVGNKIMLVADGDIEVGDSAALTAITITNTAASTSTVTQGGFTLTKDIAADRAEGTIILRADQNADDVNDGGTAATITLNNDKDNFQGVNVKLYYNDEITADGVNGTAATTIGITGATGKDGSGNFTMKNYASGYGATLEAKVADTVTATENTAGTADTSTSNVTVDKNAYSLINDVYQLQAIDNQNTATYLGYKYALGGDIDASDTANWTTFDNNSGFDPIGLSDVSTNRGLNYKGSQWKTYNFPGAFTGKFTGNGGTGNYSIYDLNIKRTVTSTLNYIGLFAVTYGATISDLTIVEPVISGYYDIGSVVGYANRSKLENLTARKRVAELDGKTSSLTTANISGTANMGGIVGTAAYTSIYNCVNSTQITGKEYIGGITGTALNDHHDGSAAIDSCINKGYYSPNETVAQGYGVINATGSYIGGLAGIIAYAGETATITNSYSNGQVYGTDYVGGLIGRMDNGTASITNSYNSNEAEPGKATIIADENAEQSIYGKVVANGASAGGIIGAAGAINNNSKPNITIANVYNSGNVTATTNAGGIVGYFGGGTLKISNSYNADNNTVLKDTNNYSGFKCNDANGATREYVYDSTTQKWYAKDASATQYSEKELEKIAPMSERLYNTRLAYRDATVTTSVAAANAGGIIGYAGAGVTLENTYSAGKVYDTSTNTTKVAGGLVGTAVSGAKANGTNFYITEQNVTGSISGDATAAVHTGTLTGTAEGWTLWKAQNTDFGDSAIWYYSPGSTTPLLRSFMTGTVSAGKTQYVYDGSAHLVDTSSVASGFATNGMGYYGNGAFSTGVDGDNFGRGVNVKNSAAATATADNLNGITYGTNADGIDATNDDVTTNSSFYSYAQSNLWSPQHGYRTDATRGLVITPKSVTYTVNDATKTYGNVELDAGSTIGGVAGGLVAGDALDETQLKATVYDADGKITTVGTFTTTGMEKTKDVTDAGYTITANHADIQAAYGDNYDVTVKDGTLTINQRELTYTISGATKVYGETMLDSLTGTWSGYIDDDSDDFAGTVDIVETEGAVTATAAITSAGLDSTAGVADKHDDITVADSTVFSALITNKNYKLKETDGVVAGTGAELKVTPREVTYQVKENSKTYGDAKAAADFSGTFTDVLTGTAGLVNNDKVTLDNDTYTVDGHVDTDTKAGATTYTGAITVDETKLATALGANYKVTKTTGADFTIDKKTITIEVGNNSKTYGSTTADKEFTSTIKGLVNNDELKLDQSAYSSAALANEQQGADSYTDITADATEMLKTDVGKNYQLAEDGIKKGTLTVNKKDIIYVVDDNKREFLDANPTNNSGSFADAKDGKAVAGTTGYMIWDKDKVGTLAQGDYQINIGVGADVDDYTGAIVVDQAVASALLGEAADNYNVTVQNGTLSVTQTTGYYRPESTTYNPRTGELVLTGSIVKADGTEIGSVTAQKYLSEADFRALKFLAVDENGKALDTSSLTPGKYNIIGTDAKGNDNYRISLDDWYRYSGLEGAKITVIGGGTSDIIPDVPHYEWTKDGSLDPQPKSSRTDLGGDSIVSRRQGIIGGVIPDEARTQIRFLTVIDSGINIGAAPSAIEHITIDPSSYAAESESEKRLKK